MEYDGAPDRAVRDPGDPLGGVVGRVRGNGPGGSPGTAADRFQEDRLAELAAATDSANYVSDRMTRARRHADRFDLLGDALRASARDGLIAEFGVFEGATINFLAGQTSKAVFGFDAFSGLPEDWRPGFPKGTFNRGIPPVRPNVCNCSRSPSGSSTSRCRLRGELRLDSCCAGVRGVSQPICGLVLRSPCTVALREGRA